MDQKENPKQQWEVDAFIIQGMVVAIKTSEGKWLCTFCKCKNEFDSKKQFISHFAEWHVCDLTKPAKW